MRKLITTRIALSILAGLFGYKASAQNLDSLIDQHIAGFKQERLYLHYDKSAYSAGDTVWFKAYMMTEFYPSEESKTIYIDWLDEKGTVLSHTVAPVFETTSQGQFLVPENYTGNVIQVRAYTRWMLNFDSAFLYNKSLPILLKTPSPAPTKIKKITSVQFLPEGGNAVVGLKNKIAFKATDQWGQPVRISGTIHDGAGAAVETFKSTHNGMGYFFLAPKAGASYAAKWKDESGQQQTTTLPLVKPSGIALNVTVSGTKRIVKLERNADTDTRFNQLHVVGTMFQNKVFSTVADLSAKTINSKIIPTTNLPTGILTITVFDAANNAIAERITYVKNDTYSFQPEGKRIAVRFK